MSSEATINATGDGRAVTQPSSDAVDPSVPMLSIDIHPDLSSVDRSQLISNGHGTHNSDSRESSTAPSPSAASVPTSPPLSSTSTAHAAEDLRHEHIALNSIQRDGTLTSVSLIQQQQQMQQGRLLNAQQQQRSSLLLASQRQPSAPTTPANHRLLQAQMQQQHQFNQSQRGGSNHTTPGSVGRHAATLPTMSSSRSAQSSPSINPLLRASLINASNANNSTMYASTLNPNVTASGSKLRRPSLSLLSSDRELSGLGGIVAALGGSVPNGGFGLTPLNSNGKGSTSTNGGPTADVGIDNFSSGSGGGSVAIDLSSQLSAAAAAAASTSPNSMASMRPDAMISYSRKDIHFVRRLYQHFENMNRNVWVDFMRIPAAVDFMESIHSGIKESNSFLYIISPDSVASKYCDAELDYALQYGKRIIPIVIREVAPEKVRPEVQVLNYIFCTGLPTPVAAATAAAALANGATLPPQPQGISPSAALHDVFPLILASVLVDPAFVLMHTKLLVRAVEWEESNEDPSFLATGRELDEANRFMKKAEEYAAAEVANKQRRIKSGNAAATTLNGLSGNANNNHALVTALAPQPTRIQKLFVFASNERVADSQRKEKLLRQFLEEDDDEGEMFDGEYGHLQFGEDPLQQLSLSHQNQNQVETELAALGLTASNAAAKQEDWDTTTPQISGRTIPNATSFNDAAAGNANATREQDIINSPGTTRVRSPSGGGHGVAASSSTANTASPEHGTIQQQPASSAPTSTGAVGTAASPSMQPKPMGSPGRSNSVVQVSRTNSFAMRRQTVDGSSASPRPIVPPALKRSGAGVGAGGSMLHHHPFSGLRATDRTETGTPAVHSSLHSLHRFLPHLAPNSQYANFHQKQLRYVLSEQNEIMKGFLVCVAQKEKEKEREALQRQMQQQQEAGASSSEFDVIRARSASDMTHVQGAQSPSHHPALPPALLNVPSTSTTNPSANSSTVGGKSSTSSPDPLDKAVMSSSESGSSGGGFSRFEYLRYTCYTFHESRLFHLGLRGVLLYEMLIVAFSLILIFGGIVHAPPVELATTSAPNPAGSVLLYWNNVQAPVMNDAIRPLRSLSLVSLAIFILEAMAVLFLIHTPGWNHAPSHPTTMTTGSNATHSAATASASYRGSFRWKKQKTWLLFLVISTLIALLEGLSWDCRGINSASSLLTSSAFQFLNEPTGFTAEACAFSSASSSTAFANLYIWLLLMRTVFLLLRGVHLIFLHPLLHSLHSFHFSLLHTKGVITKLKKMVSLLNGEIQSAENASKMKWEKLKNFHPSRRFSIKQNLSGGIPAFNMNSSGAGYNGVSMANMNGALNPPPTASELNNASAYPNGSGGSVVSTPRRGSASVMASTSPKMANSTPSSSRARVASARSATMNPRRSSMVALSPSNATRLPPLSQHYSSVNNPAGVLLGGGDALTPLVTPKRRKRLAEDSPATIALQTATPTSVQRSPASTTAAVTSSPVGTFSEDPHPVADATSETPKIVLHRAPSHEPSADAPLLPDATVKLHPDDQQPTVADEHQNGSVDEEPLQQAVAEADEEEEGEDEAEEVEDEEDAEEDDDVVVEDEGENLDDADEGDDDEQAVDDLAEADPDDVFAVVEEGDEVEAEEQPPSQPTKDEDEEAINAPVFYDDVDQPFIDR